MNEVTWLVVADGGRARVFQMPGLTLDLQEKEDLVNDEYSGTVLTEKDREKFAKRVSDYLEQGRLHQLYHRLRLAVEPKFLGMVRANLSEDTRRLISVGVQYARNSGAPAARVIYDSPVSRNQRSARARSATHEWEGGVLNSRSMNRRPHSTPSLIASSSVSHSG
jgi:hypothetical protein